MKLRRLPAAARILVLGAYAGGLAAIAIRVPQVVRFDLDDLVAVAILAAAMLALEQFSLPLRLRSETINFTLTDAVWAAGLMLTGPAVLTVALAAGVFPGQLLKRWHPVKVAFNVSVYLIGITAAEALYAAIAPPAATSPKAWLAVAAGMAVVASLNAVMVSLVVSLVEHKTFGSVFLPPLAVDALHRLGNLAIGIVVAVQAVLTPLALPISAILMGLAYAAYRGWIQGLRERERLRDLYEAGRLLMKPLHTNADFQPILCLVKRMLDASRVELSVVRDGHVFVECAGSDEDAGEPAPSTASPEVTLVTDAEGIRAVLSVHRDKPLSTSERTVLDALASQIAVLLENQRAFVDVMERAEMSEVVHHTWDGIFMLAEDGTILSWNPSMERVTGFAPKEALGRLSSEVLGIVPDGDGLAPSNGGLRSGSGRSLDTVLMDRQGAEHWIRYTHHRMGERGNERGYLVVARDVTADLESERLKADLVATVSHELRTPLTPLKGFLLTLMRGTAGSTEDERQEFYRIMLNQTNRLEYLIMNLLETARIESAGASVGIQAFQLASLVADRVRDFSEQHPERVIRHLNGHGPILAKGDALRADQVLANLISNAVRYTPAGEPIEVSVETDARQAIVTVRDNGPGIPREDQALVFDRFYRVDNGLAARTGGTGLGLYISKRLVEAMGGRLWVDSEPGKGSAFRFTVPLADSAIAQGNGSLRAEVGATA